MSAPLEKLLQVLASTHEQRVHVLDRITRHDEARILAGQLIELLRDAGALGTVETVREAIAAGGDITRVACSLARIVSFDDVALQPHEIGGAR